MSAPPSSAQLVPSNRSRSSSSSVKQPKPIVCSVCLRVFTNVAERDSHAQQEWTACYGALHERLFGSLAELIKNNVLANDDEELPANEVVQLPVSRDLLYYPSCSDLGCTSLSPNHRCRFVPVMKPVVVRFKKQSDQPHCVTHPLNTCMGQKPMAIVHPDVDRNLPAPTLTVVRSQLVTFDPASREQTMVASSAYFRYERLTGQPSPVALNHILKFQHAKVPRVAKKVLVLLGDMDLDTMSWVRGTRLSPSLVAGLTILLLLKTPRTSKDYLLCAFDGPDSKLYDTTKFNFMTQLRWSDLLAAPIDYLFERLFQSHVKRLRKTGAIDYLWGKPHLILNILFNLRKDRGIQIPAQYQAEFDAAYEQLHDDSQARIYKAPLVDLMLNKPFDKEWAHKYDQAKDEAQQHVQLICLLKQQIQLTIDEAKLKIKEIVDAGDPQELRVKRTELENRIRRFIATLASGPALGELSRSIGSHIRLYQNERESEGFAEDAHEKTHDKIVFDLDVSPLIDDFCRDRKYAWINLNTGDDADTQPTICNLDATKFDANRRPLDFKDKINKVMDDSSRDKSILVQVSFQPNAGSASSSAATPPTSPLPCFQPFYLLTSSDMHQPFMTALRQSSMFKQLVDQLAIDRHFPEALVKQLCEAPPTLVSIVKERHPDTSILIFVLDHRRQLIVSGERPRKNETNIQRAAHSQLAQGLFVYAAGEMIFKMDGRVMYLAEITNGSGHYKPNTKTLGAALQKFTALAGRSYLPSTKQVQLTNSVACGIPVLSQI